MAKVFFGNHSAVRVPRTEKDKIRQFYCNVLGCKITRELDWKDDIRVGDNFYIAFLYGDDADESVFLRTGKSVWLEIKSDNVEEPGSYCCTHLARLSLSFDDADESAGHTRSDCVVLPPSRRATRTGGLRAEVEALRGSGRAGYYGCRHRVGRVGDAGVCPR